MLLSDEMLSRIKMSNDKMKEYIFRIMRYRAVTRIAKEWLKLDLVSAREYKKVCRFIAKDLLIDLRSIFLEME